MNEMILTDEDPIEAVDDAQPNSRNDDIEAVRKILDKEGTEINTWHRSQSL